MLDFLRRKEKAKQVIVSEAILDMSDHLIRYGFPPDKAMKVAKNFWGKHRGKISDVI